MPRELKLTVSGAWSREWSSLPCTRPATGSPVCVSWDILKNSWTSEGCETTDIDDVVECDCNHLGIFSVSIQLKGELQWNGPDTAFYFNFVLLTSAIVTLIAALIYLILKKP